MECRPGGAAPVTGAGSTVIAKAGAGRTTMAGVVPDHGWDLLRASVDGWARLARMSEIWWTRSTGRFGIEAARGARFDALVEFARARSPFYRDAWRGLPARRLLLAELPVVTKAALMARFDDWVTAPEISLDAVLES